MAHRRKSSPFAPSAPPGSLLVLVALVAAAGIGSMLLGQDANWDLQNYHYYNAWAWWHGRIFTRDVAAAQIQTFHNPLLDLPFFAMLAADWPPRVVALALSIPAALAAFFLYELSRLLFAELPRRQRIVAIACSVTVGTTSAMGIGALGNTMNEWPLAALTTFALWWIARALIRADGGRIPSRALLVAGALVGLAAGAKLTAAPFAVGLCAAILARGPYTRDGFRARLSEASWFAVAAAAGIAIAYGPWAYELWKHFESPIFPYGNQWFRSPWWEPRPVPGRSFGPHGVAQWLAFPFELASPPLYRVAEVAYRDARIPLTFAFALVAAAAWLLGRSSRDAVPPRSPGVRAAWRLVTLFAIFSFLVWTATYSIYRYLLPLDLLTGALIAGLLWKLCRPRFAAGAALFVSAMLLATTSVANWGRVSFGDRWFEVKVPLPQIEPDALVLITTGEAVSYFIPFLPPTSRYLGALNTLVVPGQRSRLADTVSDIVRDHRGPLYQLTYPLTEGKEALAMHGLARTTACAVVVTNMPTSPLEVCLLVRSPETR